MTILTVDAVLLTVADNELQVGLIKRDKTQTPFPNRWSLPGGYVHEDEDVDVRASANRVLLTKAGATSPYLDEFGTRSGRLRDPRGWSMTVIYYALVPASVIPQGTKLFPVSNLPKLAFDHNEIVTSVVSRVRSKASYSSLPVFLLEKEFTFAEMQSVYEIVKGEPQAPANFQRKINQMEMLEKISGGMKRTDTGRHPQLYRVRPEFMKQLAVRERGI